MIYSKKTVSKIGAALCVVPFFLALVPTIWAQQGNDQVRLLSQMTEMQQEIAQLRDMVERQAYQISQLQNTNAQAANQPGPQSSYQNPSLDTNGSQYTSVYEPSARNQPSAGNQPSVDTNPAASQEGYSPYNDSQSVSIDGRPAVNTASEYPVEPQQTTVAQPDAGLGYPPVEERTIGGSPDRQQAPVYNPETYNQPDPVVNPQVNQGDYGQQAPVSNSQEGNFPTPYQRQEPARVPVVNNIPNGGVNGNVPATGGVISIPSETSRNSQAVNDSAQAVNNNAQAVNNGAQAVPTEQTASVDERTYYQQGFGLLKESKHDEAVSIFKQQISSYPNGEYADDAHYWVAESLYVNRNLDESKLYFKAITDNFAQSSRVPDAMLKTAYIEQEQGNQIEARILLQEIIQFHPRSNAAISAKNRLADLN